MLCLSNYKFLPACELEVIPVVNNVSIYFLSYPGFILLLYNYIYLVILSSSHLYLDRLFYKQFYLVSQYLFHLTYAMFFASEWKVRNRAQYWAQVKTYVTPLLVLIHIYLLALFSQESYLMGTVLSFYMGLYWQTHIRMLRNINAALTELEVD